MRALLTPVVEPGCTLVGWVCHAWPQRARAQGKPLVPRRTRILQGQPCADAAGGVGVPAERGARRTHARGGPSERGRWAAHGLPAAAAPRYCVRPRGGGLNSTKKKLNVTPPRDLTGRSSPGAARPRRQCAAACRCTAGRAGVGSAALGVWAPCLPIEGKTKPQGSRKSAGRASSRGERPTRATMAATGARSRRGRRHTLARLARRPAAAPAHHGLHGHGPAEAQRAHRRRHLV